jgi:hypothetical protein
VLLPAVPVPACTEDLFRLSFVLFTACTCWWFVYLQEQSSQKKGGKGRQQQQQQGEAAADDMVAE